MKVLEVVSRACWIMLEIFRIFFFYYKNSILMYKIFFSLIIQINEFVMIAVAVAIKLVRYEMNE